MDSKERLGIFCFYDKNGIVGEYIKTYLESILPYLKELVIVCNGQLSDMGRGILKKYTNQIFVRENRGMDGGAYQDVILNILGLDYIHKYDELLIFNDTIYAPIDSWETVFAKMQSEEVDFWGLTQNRTKKIPLHIQSYFIMFCKKVLHSEEFAFFWRNLDAGQSDKNKVIANFEINLTYFLGKKGYSWDTFSHCSDKDMCRDPYFFLHNEGVPALKRNVFSHLGDFMVTDEERKKAGVYVKEQSEYDFGMIEEELRRKEGRDFNELRSKNPEPVVRAEREICWEEMLSYASRYEKCYLYGNTLNAYVLRNLLEPGKIKGMIVSDAYGAEKTFAGKEAVLQWSEVSNEGEGLIVTLGYQNAKKLKNEIVNRFPEAMFYWEL